mmetsp:Transcript_30761/g.100353  ORF Transcript_30761/g.100353 Transcript_30761/m.100353 type:complete len:374 (-) Transcript_30761:44-1165(-)
MAAVEEGEGAAKDPGEGGAGFASRAAQALALAGGAGVDAADGETAPEKGSALLQGLAFRKASGWRWDGLWSQIPPPSAAVEEGCAWGALPAAAAAAVAGWHSLTVNPLAADVSGQLTGMERAATVRGALDSYLVLAFTRDTRSLWRQGRPVFSPVASSYGLRALLQEHFCPEVMDGANAVQCEGCGSVTAVVRASALLTAPSHLMVAVKRFEYDYRTGRSTKISHTLDIPPSVRVPLAHGAGEGQGGAAQSATATALYGLYAIVVHAGERATSGHYYSFARDSWDARALLSPDSDLAPWRRLDDTRVEATTFDRLRDLLRRVSDTAYMLLFRRVDEGAEEDAAEAPLLSTPCVRDLAELSALAAREAAARGAL